MSTEIDKKLEQYLFDLEKSISDFPPSLKAKVISEINQHIHEAREKFPDKSVAQILDDLGPATKVANHYRLDSGFKTFKPNKHPFWKYFTIIFLGSILIFSISIGILVWRFTPVIKIDEENQRFMLFGGLVDINGKSGKVKFFDQYKFVENKYTNEFEGTYTMQDTQDEILINFNAGKMDLINSPDRNIKWLCKLEQAPTQDIVSLKNDSIKLKLDDFGNGSCVIEVPMNAKVQLDGLEGEVTIKEPEYDIFVDMENGAINFIHAPNVEYQYSLRLQNGPKARFPDNSNNPNAYEIQLELENGNLNYQ
tara:strand:+ start:6009 stop:6932 length:924 start_codon:yes stop_codon:yes gene_type:complete